MGERDEESSEGDDGKRGRLDKIVNVALELLGLI